MSICMSTCLSTCLYTCLPTLLNTCLHTRIYTCPHTLHTCLHTRLYTCPHTCLRICLHTRLCVDVHTHTYTSTHMSMHLFTRISIRKSTRKPPRMSVRLSIHMPVHTPTNMSMHMPRHIPRHVRTYSFQTAAVCLGGTSCSFLRSTSSRTLPHRSTSTFDAQRHTAFWPIKPSCRDIAKDVQRFALLSSFSRFLSVSLHLVLCFPLSCSLSCALLCYLASVAFPLFIYPCAFLLFPRARTDEEDVSKVSSKCGNIRHLMHPP